jgi:hypothetical protein
MVGRPSSLRRLRTIEAEAGQIKLIDENVDYTNRIIAAHEVIEMLREQRALFAIRAFDKALHLNTRFHEILAQRLPDDFAYTGSHCARKFLGSVYMVTVDYYTN